MPRYRFAAFWATVLVVIGLLLVVGGVALAAAAVTFDMPWGSLTGQAVLERVLAAIVLAISGVLAGAPFIVLGEMMKLLIDQRRIIERQRRLLTRIAQGLEGADEPDPREVDPRAAGYAAADRLLRQRRP
jgi:hypothetical protein